MLIAEQVHHDLGLQVGGEYANDESGVKRYGKCTMFAHPPGNYICGSSDGPMMLVFLPAVIMATMTRARTSVLPVPGGPMIDKVL